MEDFKVGQLTKELVAIRLKQMEDPCAVAADLVGKTLRVALKALPPGDPARGKVIEDAVHGGMQGLLLAEQNMARSGVLALAAVAELTTELELDPAEALRGALRGLARLARLLDAEQIEELRLAVERHFNGAGAVFAALLEEQPGGAATRSGAAGSRDPK